MIRTFGFSNFMSFKENVVLSFELDGKTPHQISQGKGLTPVMGIKGANGSGKTNVLRALSFLSYFCVNGARDTIQLKTGEKKSRVAVQNFFDNDEPTEFFIDFSKYGIDYTYELRLKNGSIEREYLAKKSKRSVVLIEREFNEIKQSLKVFDEFKDLKLSSDASILEIASQRTFKEDISELLLIQSFFMLIISNVNYYGYTERDFNLFDESENLHHEQSRLDFYKSVIAIADSSISDITIEPGVDSDGKNIFFPYFHHLTNIGTKKLTFGSQSEGTKKLFKILGDYFTIINTGGVLVLDEFDTHLHAMILPIIINLFLNTEINKHGAQLVFTSHNTEIIDTLGKYRTFLVNKEESESFGYRLDEIPGNMVRNDRPISPLYSDGKIGGIPIIDEENLQQIISVMQKEYHATPQ